MNQTADSHCSSSPFVGLPSDLDRRCLRYRITCTLERGIFLLLVSTIIVCLGQQSATASSLIGADRLFQQSKENGRYTPPDSDELETAEKLFIRILLGERGEHIAQDWQNLGFQLQRAKLDDRIVLALLEDKKRRHGRGFFLFPEDPTGSSMLMIPHRFYDMHTGPIGMKYFAIGSFSAAAWNTVHRHKKGTSKTGFTKDDESLPNWDMADLQDSYFTVLTSAFTKTFPAGHLLQLHGFSKEKRKSWAGRDSDIVLSNGTQSPPDDLVTFSDCLKMNVGAMVRVYPIEIRDLGATENTSARIMAAHGKTGFIQMELSLPIRQKLLESDDFSRVFTNCMQESWH